MLRIKFGHYRFFNLTLIKKFPYSYIRISEKISSCQPVTKISFLNTTLFTKPFAYRLAVAFYSGLSNVMTSAFPAVKDLYSENIPINQETSTAFYQEILEKMRNLANSLSGTSAIELHLTMSADELKEKVTKLTGLVEQFVNGLVSIPKEELSFANSLQPFALMEGIFQTVGSSFNFPHYVSTDAAIREASVGATKTLDDFRVELYMRKDLFETFKAVSESDEARLLKGEDHRILEKVMLDFKRNGLYLSDEKYERMKELKKKLSNLCVDFAQTVNEDTTFILFTMEELEGCSDVFLKSLERVNENGMDKYKVTMKYPDLFGVLQYAKKEETRKQLDYVNSTRCQSNSAVLFEIMQIRKEISALLGYPDHASYVVEEKMVKTPGVAIKVIE